MDAVQLRKDTEASVEDSPEHEQKHPQFTDGVVEKLEMFINISQHLFHGLQYYWNQHIADVCLKSSCNLYTFKYFCSLVKKKRS